MLVLELLSLVKTRLKCAQALEPRILIPYKIHRLHLLLLVFHFTLNSNALNIVSPLLNILAVFFSFGEFHRDMN